MPRKLTLEQFIEILNTVHNNKYDYSMVVYAGANAKIQITCPIHGPFTQRAGDHRNGSGCKHCSQLTKIQTNLVKYGTKYPGQNKEVKEKRKQTNLERYGFENAAQNRDVIEKIQQTNLERYGVNMHSSI